MVASAQWDGQLPGVDEKESEWMNIIASSRREKSVARYEYE
jgi:hypothetical protein